ncbi:hypothetical protein [Pyxidicoccus xibeiensis]|uniref:hypothetical protein n=1 Tax=Pyxidicoccus xibeiensis TaxID=2906759 RepID=UPI0020A826E3|nr:hypothetical protein [Pyxidicoccus xibeiensis]MCP3145160.1 hypothetical protein [Pyxidicoccus xibeiensis]
MTSPEPDAPRLSPTVLIAALRAMEPRPSALLNRRLVEGRSQEDCATFYGVSTSAISVLLLRAAVVLARDVGLPAREPAGDDEEAAWARMLAEALLREDAPLPAALVPVAEVCRRLRAAGHDVAAGLELASREDAASPHRRREEWLRRLAVAALLALTAYLYLSRPEEPPRRQRPPVRSAPAPR